MIRDPEEFKKRMKEIGITVTYLSALLNRTRQTIREKINRNEFDLPEISKLKKVMTSKGKLIT